MHFSTIPQKIAHKPLTISLNMDLELPLRVKHLVQCTETWLQSALTKKVKEQLEPTNQDASLITIWFTNGL